MLIYHFELSLEDGFKLLEKEKPDRLYRGRQISACSGWDLFRSLKGRPIRCWECGVLADRWIADKGKTDTQGYPVLNLYCCKDGKITLMNQDHIIPRSLGGVDDVENLRPACEHCNGKRGNKMNAVDIDFMMKNLNLFSPVRFLSGEARARKATLEGKVGVDTLAIFAAIRATLHARHTGISLQIGGHVPGPVKKKKKRKKVVSAAPPVIKSKPKDVLISDPLEQARLASRGVTMYWQNGGGKFVGPFVEQKDLENL